MADYSLLDPVILAAAAGELEWSDGFAILALPFDAQGAGAGDAFTFQRADPAEYPELPLWVPNYLRGTFVVYVDAPGAGDLAIALADGAGDPLDAAEVAHVMQDGVFLGGWGNGVPVAVTFHVPAHLQGVFIPLTLRVDAGGFANTTIGVVVLALVADQEFPLPSDSEPVTGTASGRLYKETLKSYVLGTPGTPGVPAVPDIPGRWSEEEVTETWYEEQIAGYYEIPVYGTDPSTGELGQIGTVWIPRIIYVPHTRTVKRWVWHPPVPGTPAIPPTPPTPTQVVTDRQLGWNASADGALRAGGNVRFEFLSDTDNYGAVVGLSDPAGVPTVGYQNIRYAFYLTTGTYRVMESGKEMTPERSFPPGTLFAVVRVGKSVRYYVRGELVYTSLKTADQAELQPDAALYAGDDTIYGYRLLVGTAALLSGQAGKPLTALRQVLGKGSKGSGADRSRDQMLPPLRARGGLAGDGGWTRSNRLPPLGGFASEEGANYSRSHLAALRQRRGAGGQGRLAALRTLGGAGGGVAAQHGRLPALRGSAWSTGGFDRANAVLPALVGFAADDPVVWARARFGALRSEGGTYAAGDKARATGRMAALAGAAWMDRPPAFSRSQRVAALTGRIGHGVDQGGRGRIAALTGAAFEDAGAFARGRLAALTGRVGAGVDAGARARLAALWGQAFEDADGYSAGQRFAALLGNAKGPGAAGGSDSRLAALLGFGMAKKGETRARGALAALTGKADTFAGKTYGRASLAPLWGIASDTETFCWAHAALRALQGAGEGGFIVPPRPVEAAGWLPALVSWGHGYVRAGYGTGVLGALIGLGSDRPIAVQRSARLAPLGHLWSGEYDPPSVCSRYIPRLWLRALGIRQGARYGLPIACDAVLTAQAEPLRARCDARLARRGTLWAAATAEIARVQRPTATVDAALAKPRTRKARANAWLERP